MRPGTLMRILLLGLGLSAGPASAAEIAAATERTDAGASRVRPSSAGDAAASRPHSGVKKVGVVKGKGAADTASALKKDNSVAARRSSVTGEGAPEDTAPPAEPQSVALRGVRG